MEKQIQKIKDRLKLDYLKKNQICVFVIDIEKTKQSKLDWPVLLWIQAWETQLGWSFDSFHVQLTNSFGKKIFINQSNNMDGIFGMDAGSVALAGANYDSGLVISQNDFDHIKELCTDVKLAIFHIKNKNPIMRLICKNIMKHHAKIFEID